MSEQRGDTGYLSTSAGLLAEALYQQGGDADAWQASETSERSAAADDFVSQMLWRSVRAKLLARRGEHEEAERLARETVAIGEPSDYLFVRGDSLRDLAEVLLLAGRRAAAAEAARAALGLYQRKGDLVSAARVQELLASRERRDAQRSLR
jgi:tetratricopeptide (TPR) repeat protein